MSNKISIVLGTLALAWGVMGGSVAGTCVSDAVDEVGTFNADVNRSARYYIYLRSASWCGACRVLMPKVVAEYEDMKEADVELVLVSADYTKEAAEDYLEEYHAEFPAVVVENPKELPGFKAGNCVPWMCIVDANGKLIKAGVGGSVFPEWKNLVSGNDSDDDDDATVGSASAGSGACVGSSCDTAGSAAAGSGACVGSSCDTPAAGSTAADNGSGSCIGNECNNIGTAADSDDEEPGSVATALEDVETFNAELNTKAKYYVYLEAASWCGYCRNEMPAIVQAYQEMKDADVEIILIGADSTPQDCAAFLEKYGAEFPGVHVRNSVVSQLPGFTRSNGIPSATIVTADGELIKSGHGSIIKNWKKYINVK